MNQTATNIRSKPKKLAAPEVTVRSVRNETWIDVPKAFWLDGWILSIVLGLSAFGVIFGRKHLEAMFPMFGLETAIGIVTTLSLAALYRYWRTPSGFRIRAKPTTILVETRRMFWPVQTKEFDIGQNDDKPIQFFLNKTLTQEFLFDLPAILSNDSQNNNRSHQPKTFILYDKYTLWMTAKNGNTFKILDPGQIPNARNSMGRAEQALESFYKIEDDSSYDET